MPSALSIDLRERVVAAMAERAFCHDAAARFGVSASSASRWAERLRQEGRVAPRSRGGHQRSLAIEAHADLICATYEVQPAICLHEVCATLAERGVTNGTSGLSRFFARHRITRKRGRCTWPSRQRLNECHGCAVGETPLSANLRSACYLTTVYPACAALSKGSELCGSSGGISKNTLSDPIPLRLISPSASTL